MSVFSIFFQEKNQHFFPRKNWGALWFPTKKYMMLLCRKLSSLQGKKRWVSSVFSSKKKISICFQEKDIDECIFFQEKTKVLSVFSKKKIDEYLLSFFSNKKLGKVYSAFVFQTLGLTLLSIFFQEKIGLYMYWLFGKLSSFQEKIDECLHHFFPRKRYRWVFSAFFFSKKKLKWSKSCEKRAVLN